MSKLLVINVLSPEYYGDCHIIHSINIPLEKLEESAHNLNKNMNIVVYCANYNCTGSVQAWKKLTILGFNNVWAYEGGTNEWYHLGLPVDGLCKQKYLGATIENHGQDRGANSITAEELKKMMAEQELEGNSCCSR